MAILPSNSSTNYRDVLGIHNKWAPILFAVLYFFLFIYYVAQAIRRHAAIYGGLAFFSAGKSSLIPSQNLISCTSQQSVS